jgi:hypothetical protein
VLTEKSPTLSHLLFQGLQQIRKKEGESGCSNLLCPIPTSERVFRRFSQQRRPPFTEIDSIVQLATPPIPISLFLLVHWAGGMAGKREHFVSLLSSMSDLRLSWFLQSKLPLKCVNCALSDDPPIYQIACGRVRSAGNDAVCEDGTDAIHGHEFISA